MIDNCSAFYFNSRPCVRGDPLRQMLVTQTLNFNSRPCVRGDREILDDAENEKDFNSRPCVRGDPCSQPCC